MRFCDGKNSKKKKENRFSGVRVQLKGWDQGKDMNVPEETKFKIHGSTTVFTHLLDVPPSTLRWTTVRSTRCIL